MSKSFIQGVSDSYKAEITDFLFRLFNKRSGIKSEYLSKYINEDTIYKFALAFTHESYDPLNNYEYFETLGDATLNKCAVWYFHRRFPELRTLQDANYRMSLLKKQNVSKELFAKLSEKLGLDKIVRYKQSYNVGTKTKFVLVNNKLRTDIFEAVMGCIEDVIDEKEHIFVGASVVYNIFASLMDEMPFSYDIEMIEDSKTKIVQMESQKKVIKIKFEDTFTDNIVTTEEGKERKERTYAVTLSVDFLNPSKNKIENVKFGPSYAKNKQQAEKNVSNIAIDYLKKIGVN